MLKVAVLFCLIYPLIAVLCLVTVFPSLFLLLVVRMNKIETDTKKLNIRRDKLEAESRRKRCCRLIEQWIRSLFIFSLIGIYSMMITFVIIPRFGSSEVALHSSIGLYFVFREKQKAEKCEAEIQSTVFWCIQFSKMSASIDSYGVMNGADWAMVRCRMRSTMREMFFINYAVDTRISAISWKAAVLITSSVRTTSFKYILDGIPHWICVSCKYRLRSVPRPPIQSSTRVKQWIPPKTRPIALCVAVQWVFIGLQWVYMMDYIACILPMSIHYANEASAQQIDVWHQQQSTSSPWTIMTPLFQFALIVALGIQAVIWIDERLIGSQQTACHGAVYQSARRSALPQVVTEPGQPEPDDFFYQTLIPISKANRNRDWSLSETFFK